MNDETVSVTMTLDNGAELKTVLDAEQWEDLDHAFKWQTAPVWRAMYNLTP